MTSYDIPDGDRQIEWKTIFICNLFLGSRTRQLLPAVTPLSE